MTLRNLSDKEIKTINGGTGYDFQITGFFLAHALGTLGNLKNLIIGAWDSSLGLLML